MQHPAADYHPGSVQPQTIAVLNNRIQLKNKTRPLLPPDGSQPKQEFFVINGLRFMAAFWVLIFHASIHFGKIERLSIIQPVISQGVLAMTLFFMLSGFILSYRYERFSCAEDYHNYAAARLARLYPVYVFSGVLTLWRISSTMEPFTLPDRFGVYGGIAFIAIIIFLFSFAIQAWFPSLFDLWNFGGSWSLSVEAFFYTLFPKFRNSINSLNNTGLRSLVYGMPVVMFMIVAGLLASYTGEPGATRIFYVLPIFRIPEFILGIAGYILFIQRQLDLRLLKRASLLLTGLFLAVLLVYGDLPGLIDWGWLIAIPFMGVFVFSLHLNGTVPIKRITNYLGRISYCVYMAQFSTIPVLKIYKGNFSVETAWILLILTTLILAIIIYHFVELPAYAKMHRFGLMLFSYLTTQLNRHNRDSKPENKSGYLDNL